MYNHSNSYRTIAEEQAWCQKKIREWDRQVKYERNIVRSVPERSIIVCSVIYDNNEVLEPG